MAAYVSHMDYMSSGGVPTSQSKSRKRTMAGDPSWRKRVGERAHAIWEREGRPYGRAGDHWLQAERELLEEESEPGSSE
ncbi:Protein of unknown function [Arboricoccus pini]|uniref:DUF2934 domain-containing protein n=1 Tax=Arboricoccus pini TaxID=1963835 RepID=A0A212RGR4_9PROT|nr:DUF2934 domain-containing protein [Arboricoccus pini]SNB71556.1 Protein of unknown function [Arboricoccus pini]